MSEASRPAPMLGSEQTRRSPDYRELYSNHMSFGFTAWDLFIAFSRTVLAPDMRTEIEQLSSIRLSPQSFKFLTESMSILIAEWEKTFGEIKNAPELGPNEKNLLEGFVAFQEAMKGGHAG